MTARESVAREWHAQSDHAVESPFGGPMCNCLPVADRIIPMMRKVFDEGWFTAIGSAPDDVWFDEWTNGPEQDNPYENGDQS